MQYSQTVPDSADDIDDSLIGGNKSAEQGDEETYSSDTTYVVNIIRNHKLQPAAALSSKQYGDVIKPYVKKVHNMLLENEAEEAAMFKSGIPNVIKKLKKMWDDLVPYTGESANLDAMMCFLNYRENGDPYMIFFKHGVIEEKCVSFSKC